MPHTPDQSRHSGRRQQTDSPVYAEQPRQPANSPQPHFPGRLLTGSSNS
jgi:hypothetical protein